MTHPSRYARVERERRFLHAEPPPDLGPPTRIVDHYLEGLRLRLRVMQPESGEPLYKLGQKYTPEPSRPTERRMTTFYLREPEYRALVARLAAGVVPLEKQRFAWSPDGRPWSVDVFAPPFDGLVVSEVEADEGLGAVPPPPGAIREVSGEPDLTCGALAARLMRGESDTFGRAGPISVRPMRDAPADLERMARWRSDPAVLEYYGGRDRPHDLASVIAKYGPRLRGEHPARPCLIELGGAPIGYLQFYPVADPSEYELEDATGVWAVDLFLGHPSLWGRGYGPAALRVILRHLFVEEGARRVVLDPHVGNARALRAYEKVGFERVKLLRGHEVHEGAARDCWLLAADPASDPSYTSATRYRSPSEP